MIASLTCRGRRILPLLAMSCLLAGLPSIARADLLTSRLTDHATLTANPASAPGLSVRVVYESQGTKESCDRAAELAPLVGLTAAALILVVPAGTVAMTPMISSTPAPPPPQQPPPQQPPEQPPSSPPPGSPNTPPPNSSPEPGSLVLALTGSGTALLAWLRRRRKAALA